MYGYCDVRTSDPSSGLTVGLLFPEQCFGMRPSVGLEGETRPVTSNILILSKALCDFLFSWLRLYWGLQITMLLSVLSVIRGCLNQDKKNSSPSPVIYSQDPGPFQSWYLHKMPCVSHSPWRILVNSGCKIHDTVTDSEIRVRACIRNLHLG